jgi:hypothetical protein
MRETFGARSVGEAVEDRIAAEIAAAPKDMSSLRQERNIYRQRLCYWFSAPLGAKYSH